MQTKIRTAMKSKLSIPWTVPRLLIIGLLGLGLARNVTAATVFEAHLSTSGSGAGLNLGRIYFREEGDRMDFLAVVFPLSALTGDLDPVLTVPGDSIQFTLGEGTRNWLHGSYTVADRNPFLLLAPPAPAGYDENGNPYYLDTMNIQLADIYTGSFTVPLDFVEALRAGLGHISFNPSMGGTLTVVPEPTAGAFMLLAGVAWCFRGSRMKLKRAVECKQPTRAIQIPGT
jgi:hypothetical protein